MMSAIRQVARDGWTSNPYLLALEAARHVNEAHGAPVVDALSVQGWPADWVDAFTEYNRSREGIQAHEKRLRKSREQWLRENNYARRAGLN